MFDYIVNYSIVEHPVLLMYISVITILLSFIGFGTMLSLWFFFRNAREFALAHSVARYYFWTSFIYLITALYGLSGVYIYSNSLDDFAFLLRPVVLAGTIVAGWKLFRHFKSTRK